MLNLARRCQQCGRNARIYGLRDPVSGWLGDCNLCNALWYESELHRGLSACARRHHVLVFIGVYASPGERKNSYCRLIWRCLGCDYAFLRHTMEVQFRIDVLRRLIQSGYWNRFFDDSDSDYEWEDELQNSDGFLLDIHVNPLLQLGLTRVRGSLCGGFDIAVLPYILLFLYRAPIMLSDYQGIRGAPDGPAHFQSYTDPRSGRIWCICSRTGLSSWRSD